MAELNTYSKPKSIELTFNCRENLDAMTPTEKGKFCSACQKEVIDFTNMSYSQIQQVRGKQTEMCGMFLPEQIDPSLHPIELPKVRSWAFLSTILLSLNFGTASAQSTVDPKVEQSQGASNAPKLTPQEAKEKSESGQHISLSRQDTLVPQKVILNSEVSDKERERHIKKRHRKAKKKFFWSTRFPFIHRKSNFKGRF
jgi:hypothetical protein